MAEPKTSYSFKAIYQLGQSLRRARIRQRKIKTAAIGIGVLVAALGATLLARPRPQLIWNVTASSPVGLYRITRPMRIEPGDMVAAFVPRTHRMMAAQRYYVPANVPLIKHVAAAPGDIVCAYGAYVTINGTRVAKRARLDGAGLNMPWWTGCITLRDGALFLLGRASASSFDGRYFGPTSYDDIVGKADILWPR